MCTRALAGGRADWYVTEGACAHARAGGRAEAGWRGRAHGRGLVHGCGRAHCLVPVRGWPPTGEGGCTVHSWSSVTLSLRFLVFFCVISWNFCRKENYLSALFLSNLLYSL